jgi:hypothetical protein
MYYQRAIVYKNIRETRIANLQRQQFPNRPNKWERPKDVIHYKSSWTENKHNTNWSGLICRKQSPYGKK